MAMCGDAACLGGVCAGFCMLGPTLWPLFKKHAIKAVGVVASQALAGATVSLSNLILSVKGGVLFVIIKGLKVGNVEGYKAENLCTIEHLCISVDFAKAWRSAIGACGMPKEVDVSMVEMTGCQFTVEKNSLTSSNFSVFLEKLKQQEDKEEGREEQPADQAPVESSGFVGGLANSAFSAVKTTVETTGTVVTAVGTTAVNTVAKAGEAAVSVGHSATKGFRKKKEEPKGMAVLIHKVDITGSKVEVTNSGTIEAGKSGQTVKIPEIKIDDVSKDLGGRVAVPKAMRYIVQKLVFGVLKGCTAILDVGGHAIVGAGEAGLAAIGQMGAVLDQPFTKTRSCVPLPLREKVGRLKGDSMLSSCTLS